jgi:hypothetical protein
MHGGDARGETENPQRRGRAGFSVKSALGDEAYVDTPLPAHVSGQQQKQANARLMKPASYARSLFCGTARHPRGISSS